MKRIHEVNKVLRYLGLPYRLTSGGDYYYFRLADSVPTADHLLFEDSVYVYRAEQMTLAEWLETLTDLLRRNLEQHSNPVAIEAQQRAWMGGLEDARLNTRVTADGHVFSRVSPATDHFVAMPR